MSQSAPKRNVSYVKPDEPSFLKKFKAKVGYKEQEVTVETKKVQLSSVDDKEVYKQDELPTVVLLEGSNVSQEELHQFVEQQKQDHSDESPIADKGSASSNKILFKKPTKRTSSEASSTSFHSSTGSKKRKEKERSSKTHNRDAIKNTSLLSFDDNDIDES